MHELERVHAYLRDLVPASLAVSLEDLRPLAGRYERRDFRAGEKIFREGQTFRKVTFLLEGIVKKYYLTSDGKEFIKEFTWEGQITAPYAALLRNSPMTYTMEAIGEVSLLLIDYAIIEELFRREPKWMAIGKGFADHHFLNREEREMELLKYSAPERYAVFKRRFPNLLGRLKKQDIAAYLGITPVSLSRLERSGKASATRRQKPAAPRR